MNKKACIVVLWMALAVTAWARLGETKLECMDRYGQAVASLPGIGNLTGVDVYVKDDIAVSLFFVRTSDEDARCGLVIYSRLRPDMQSEPQVVAPSGRRGMVVPVGEITTNEQDVVLATLPGRWEGYAGPSSLKGRSDKVISIGGPSSPTIKNREVTSLAVKKAFEVLYSPNARKTFGSTPKDIAHIGPKTFAFRIGGGLAFCSYDAVGALDAWTDYVEAQRAKAQRARKDGVKGL